jgi:cell division protein ZapA (FtsZ GTPase activity inhibitor)
MSRSDEIARIIRYDSISAFITMLRRYADDADASDRVVFIDAANVVNCLVTEVNCLTAEVERLTDKIDDLKEEIRNHQEM